VATALLEYGAKPNAESKVTETVVLFFTNVLACDFTSQPLNIFTVVVVNHEKGEASPYSSAEHRVPELIPVLGSQPADDVSHKPGGRLPLLSARPAVTLTTLKRAATNFAAW